MQTLNMTPREKLGTRAARKVRREGMIPGIIYGHGKANTPVSVSHHDIELAVQHGEHLVSGELDGQEQNFLIKDIQYDHLGHRAIHVDLTRVSLDERVEVTVPIELRGTPVGVEEEDGVLTQHLDEITLECLVTEIPESIRVFVTDLKVDQQLRVSDLPIPEGAKVLEEAETIVASVSVVSEEEAAPAEAIETAEPEVIGGKPEGEAEAGEGEES